MCCLPCHRTITRQVTPGASYSRQLYCPQVVISGTEHPPCRWQSYIRPGIRLWLMPQPALAFHRLEQIGNCCSFRKRKNSFFFLFFNVTDLWSPQAQKNELVLQRNCTFLANTPGALSCVNSKSCEGGGRGRLGARNMCVMLPLSFRALPSLAALVEDSTDAVKSVTNCARGGEGISERLCGAC